MVRFFLLFLLALTATLAEAQPDIFAHLGSRVNSREGNTPSVTSSSVSNNVGRNNFGAVSIRSICTEGDYFGQFVFRPLEIECPAFNESQLVHLKFELPPSTNGLSWSVAASYGNNKDQTEGLLVDTRVTSNQGNFTISKPDNSTWRCSAALYPHNKICVTTTVEPLRVHIDPVEFTGEILITNTDGTCQGSNIYIEAALDDQDAFDNSQTTTCTQAMETVPNTQNYTFPPEPEPAYPPHVVIFKLYYSIKPEHSREPTPEEVQKLLCRTDKFFEFIMHNKTGDMAIQSYASLLDVVYTEPDDDNLFPVNVTVLANTTNYLTGAPIDVNQVMDLMDIGMDSVLTYIYDYVKDTPEADNDVFVNVRGFRMESATHRTLESIGLELEEPWPRACPLPKEIIENPWPPTDNLCQVRSDILGHPRKYYQPLLLPCPAVGSQVIASLAHAMNFVPSKAIDPQVELDVSVAYGLYRNQTNGLGLKVVVTPLNESQACPIQDLTSTDGFVGAHLSETHTVDYDHSKPVEHQVTVQVLNENASGCVEDTLQLEVALYESYFAFHEVAYTPAECLDPLQIDTRCTESRGNNGNGNGGNSGTAGDNSNGSGNNGNGDGTNGNGDGTNGNGNGPDDNNGLGSGNNGNGDGTNGNSGGNAANDGICTMTTVQDDMGRSQMARLFPSLEVDCPGPGEKVVISFAWEMPYEANQEFSGVEISMAFSHNAGSDGLWLEVVEGMDRCDWAPGLTSPSNTQCPEWFDESKYCGSFVHEETPGDTVHYSVSIWNDGACDGTLVIEAAIDDRGIEYETSSECAVAPKRVPCEIFGSELPVGVPDRGPGAGGLNLILGGGEDGDGNADTGGDGTGNEPNRGSMFDLNLGGDGGSSGEAEDDSDATSGPGVSGEADGGDSPGTPEDPNRPWADEDGEAPGGGGSLNADAESSGMTRLSKFSTILVLLAALLA